MIRLRPCEGRLFGLVERLKRAGVATGSEGGGKLPVGRLGLLQEPGDAGLCVLAGSGFYSESSGLSQRGVFMGNYHFKIFWLVLPVPRRTPSSVQCL